MFGLFRRRKKKLKEELKTEPVSNEMIENEPEELVETELVEETKEELHEENKEAPEKKRKASNHITKHPQGGWQIKKSGASRALKRFRTQKEAIEYAKGLEESTGTAYVIHKADGKTRKKTY